MLQAFRRSFRERKTGVCGTRWGERQRRNMEKKLRLEKKFDANTKNTYIPIVICRMRQALAFSNTALLGLKLQSILHEFPQNTHLDDTHCQMHSESQSFLPFLSVTRHILRLERAGESDSERSRIRRYSF